MIIKSIFLSLITAGFCLLIMIILYKIEILHDDVKEIKKLLKRNK